MLIQQKNYFGFLSKERSIGVAFILGFLIVSFQSKSQNPSNTQDTSKPIRSVNLHYPLTDRRGDGLSTGNYNSFDFFKPSDQKDSVVFDYDTKRYVVYEKIGNRYYRTPVSYSYNEYWSIRNRQAEVDYFQQRANTVNILNRGKYIKPRLSLTDNLFNRLFGKCN